MDEMPQAPPDQAPQMPPGEQSPQGDFSSPLDKQFIGIAMDPQFGEVMQKAMDGMASPIHAAAFLLAQVVQKAEAKLGGIKDDLIYSQSGAGTKFVMIVLKMADEAGYEGAADMENVETAVLLAARMSAMGDAMAQIQGGEQPQPQQPQPPQAGLMAAAG